MPSNRERHDGERPLPHNLEAERAVLGAVLITPTVMATLPPDFRADLFYRDAHRRIFAALTRLYERRVAIDLLTLKEDLTQVGELDTVGGPAYVASLVDGVPRATNVGYYADIVRAHATRRAVITFGGRVMTAAYEAEKPPDDLLADAQRGLIEISSNGLPESAVRASEVLPAVMHIIEEASERHQPVVGVGTGYHELDVMCAGLQPGELTLVAARPSMGKTALAMNIAEHAAATTNEVALIFSLEMTRHALLQRMVAGSARVEGHRMRTGFVREAEWPRVSEALTRLADLPLVIDDTPGVPVEDLARRARRVAMRHGKIALIVVDYLQLMATRSRFENRTQQVSFISKTLKGLAKELGVPVLALSQLSRDVENRKDKRPVLSDLRESGSLEQDADLVIFLFRDERKEKDEEQKIAELIVAKQRNGPTGVVKLAFIPEYTRFENLAEGGWA